MKYCTCLFSIDEPNFSICMRCSKQLRNTYKNVFNSFMKYFRSLLPVPPDNACIFDSFGCRVSGRVLSSTDSDSVVSYYDSKAFYQVTIFQNSDIHPRTYFVTPKAL